VPGNQIVPRERHGWGNHVSDVEATGGAMEDRDSFYYRAIRTKLGDASRAQYDLLPDTPTKALFELYQMERVGRNAGSDPRPPGGAKKYLIVGWCGFLQISTGPSQTARLFSWPLKEACRVPAPHSGVPQVRRARSTIEVRWTASATFCRDRLTHPSFPPCRTMARAHLMNKLTMYQAKTAAMIFPANTTGRTTFDFSSRKLPTRDAI
jgi:hypothetical protein